MKAAEFHQARKFAETASAELRTSKVARDPPHYSFTAFR